MRFSGWVSKISGFRTLLLPHEQEVAAVVACLVDIGNYRPLLGDGHIIDTFMCQTKI